MFCPECKSELKKLSMSSKDYQRGMTHLCKGCGTKLLIVIWETVCALCRKKIRDGEAVVKISDGLQKGVYHGECIE